MKQKFTLKAEQPTEDKAKKYCSSCFEKCFNIEQKISKSKYLNFHFYKNNLAFIVFSLIYLLVLILLVLIQMYIYRHVNIYVKVARACGILIEFNMVFTILLVVRKPNTWLRSTRFGLYLPIDYFIDLHKRIGVVIIILSVIHTIAHAINLATVSRDYNKSNIVGFVNSTYNITIERYSFGELLFTTKSNVGWFYAAAMPTGWAILFLMLILVFFSIPFFRKNGHFKLFHYAHWLYLPIYIISIFHAKNFWKWFILPSVFMLFEYTLKLASIVSSNYGATYVKDVNLLPSKVTHLVITRPKSFKFKAGDYVFINLPEIAFHEFHPFTISSAPELKDELWLHVRSLGNWTNKLHEYYSKYQVFGNQKISYEPDNLKETNKKPKDEPNVITIKTEDTHNHSDNENKIPMNAQKRAVKLSLIVSNQVKNVWSRVYIDGPYRTATSRIFQAEHAVLIASGIGVTPFASILQSVWYKYSKFFKQCPNCQHEWYDAFQEKKLRKVDFIWVNRDHKSFEWFIDLLAKLESQQEMSHLDQRFIDFRLFVTQVKTKDELLTNFIKQDTRVIPSENGEKIQESANLKKIFDKIEGGRPDVGKIFGDIASKKKGEIAVFFCGNNQFGKIVNKKCAEFKFQFSREYF